MALRFYVFTGQSLPRARAHIDKARGKIVSVAKNFLQSSINDVIQCEVSRSIKFFNLPVDVCCGVCAADIASFLVSDTKEGC